MKRIKNLILKLVLSYYDMNTIQDLIEVEIDIIEDDLDDKSRDMTQHLARLYVLYDLFKTKDRKIK